MSKNVIVLDNEGGEISRYLKSSYKSDITVTHSTQLPSDCDLIIVSDDFLGESVTERVTELKCLGLPLCAATFDNSFKKQELLSASDVDDVFILPMAGALIDKKIELLTNDLKSEDLSFLDDLSSDKLGQGSFTVNEREFKKLYEFVERIIERLDKDACLVIFSFSSRFGSIVEPEMVNDFMSIVQKCLRKGDISCKSGHSLYVILMGADRNGAEVVSKRLIETFWNFCDDDAYDIDYKIKPINR